MVRYDKEILLDEGESYTLPLDGKVVSHAVHDQPDGYGCVLVMFTDGTVLRVEERGQAGSIRVRVAD